MSDGIKFGRLGFEKGTLAEQYDFFARGDLVFCEIDRSYKEALADRLRDERKKAQANGGVFSDGSTSRFVKGGPRDTPKNDADADIHNHCDWCDFGLPKGVTLREYSSIASGKVQICRYCYHSEPPVKGTIKHINAMLNLLEHEVVPARRVRLK